MVCKVPASSSPLSLYKGENKVPAQDSYSNSNSNSNNNSNSNKNSNNNDNNLCTGK